MENKDKVSTLADHWCHQLQSATQFDRWGQPIEAIDEYQRLSREMSRAVVDLNSVFSPEQKHICSSLVLNLDQRIKYLRNPSQIEALTLNKLTLESEKLRSFVSLSPSPKPQTQSTTTTSSYLLDDFLLHDMRWSLQGSLLPQPTRERGKTYLSIKIERIGLKDCRYYVNPFITISVKDAAGCDLFPEQTTPPASRLENPFYLIFDNNVHIQSCIDDLPNNFAVFFEFKHYKPRKHKLSTRCYAFLEKDEIKSGPVALELYKKPTDVFRHNLHLLSTKPLFLHLNLACDVA